MNSQEKIFPTSVIILHNFDDISTKIKYQSMRYDAKA